MDKFTPPIQNLYGYLKDLAMNQGGKTVLASYSKIGELIEEISYKDFLQLVEKVGAWMIYKGLNPGDRIAIQFPNSIELLVLSWTAWSIGIVSVPLDTKRDTIDDIKYKTELANTKLTLNPKNFNFEIINEVLEAVGNIDIPWKESLDHEALILFTSGTTGRPKGASLSLQNLIANGDGIREWFSITSDDIFMVILPLHHINSTSFCFASLLGGASIAIPPAYSASQFWAQVARTKATFTSIVPTICYDQTSMLGEYVKCHESVRLKKIQIGSAPVKPSEVQKFMDLYKIRLYQGYGQTETALRVTGIPHDVSEDLYKKLIQENSIGVPMKWAEVTVLSSDGQKLKEDEEGELAVKGPIVMKGYIGGEKAFNPDGWFMTGDLAYFKMIGDRKFYYLLGRLKEIIIKGGVNISPSAVEDRLKQIDSNIDKVCVIGVPDDRYGEEIAAAIVWHNAKNETQISRFEVELKRKLASEPSQISAYEIPAYIVTISEDEIPMTSTRKVQRSVLASQIDKKKLQPILQITKNNMYEFILLKSNNKPYMKRAFELYNHCWDPLTIDMNKFVQYIDNGTTILATKDGKVEGFLSMVITDISEDEIANSTYSQITGDLTLSTSKEQGDKVICVAIGSSNYEKKSVLDQQFNAVSKPQTPTEEEVLKYLNDGLDSVYKFHSGAKGGLSEGASLIKLMPNSRPEDESSMGYNMLMKYPSLTELEIIPNSSRSIGVQLIESAMNYATKCTLRDVYAFSRPAGLKEYLTKK
ncbi:MAG: class I adenylate-forming enzyme family protein [Candidatus Peregrinibacteria bacterium]|nr:class I adenylate-forming enzyme family protein [Candidatus Peregrinibacteria bacterium]MDZ4244439.1 class I adenylate-forming enzyme family protein [Candidatus Gracilibacteria bacterium]